MSVDAGVHSSVMTSRGGLAARGESPAESLAGTCSAASAAAASSGELGVICRRSARLAQRAQRDASVRLRAHKPQPDTPSQHRQMSHLEVLSPQHTRST